MTLMNNGQKQRIKHRKPKLINGYEIPDIDRRDLEIVSNFRISKLERIYVLDNELDDNKTKQWEEISKAIFVPLFGKFLVPQKTIPWLPELDVYTSEKENMNFNALIVQVD
jgi:hypothetical protein